MLLALVLFGWNGWGYDLWAPDEPYFGEGAREMLADGRWLVPHVNGAITTDKPPLFFWLIALASLPFGGVSSFTARLPSILAGLGSVWLVMRLGRRLAGERAGLLAGAVFATAYLPWDKARTAQIDALLCLLVLAALSAFEAFRAGDLDGRRAGLVFWLAAGLASLAKGPVGLLLPLGIALATLAWDRDLGAWRRFAPLAGPLAFAALIAAWGVPASLFGGEYSLAGALRTHFVDRGLRGMHHPNPPWYYLQTIPVQFLPWSGLLPLALAGAWRRRREPAQRLLLAWPAFVVLFFTLSGERRDLYVLPAFPALALLVALAVDPLLDGEAREFGRRWVTLPQGLLGGIFLASGLALPFLPSLPAFPLGASTWPVAIVLAGGGLALLWSAARGAVRPTVLATLATISSVYLAVASFLLPAANPGKSLRALAVAMRDASAASRAAGERVVAYRISNIPEALAFYSGVYTREIHDLGKLVAHLERPAEAFALLDERALADLPADLRRRLTVVARQPRARNTVVLVTNQPAPGRAGP
jgi:4-amino-4-deoxy-L-arabinose transferase-like glycosyltransferase